MPSLNIAVLGESPESRAAAAKSIGKESSSDDMAFYHTVFQGKIVSAIDPLAYPAKLSPLVQTLALADHALVLAERASPVLGELIVSLDFTGPAAVFVTQLDLAPFLNGTGLRESRIFDNLDEAKNFLLSQESRYPPGATKVLVDHCFEVKGVGTVALGVMARGEIKVHDKITAYPLGKEVEVKSIQKNDQDVQSAGPGDRVGLCLKGTKAGEVDRGTTLSTAPMQVGNEARCQVTVSRFCKTPLTNGTVLHAGAGLQFEPAKIECAAEIGPGATAEAKITFDNAVAWEAGEKIILTNLNAKGLRVIAAAKTL